MNKNYRVEIANKTLEIVKNGFYEYKGKKIVIEKELKESIQNTFTIAPKDWDAILKTPIENMFETEADTDLGDFLNDIVVIYFSSLHSDSLEQEIIDKICETDLDQSMLYAVGKAVLAEC